MENTEEHEQQYKEIAEKLGKETAKHYKTQILTGIKGNIPPEEIIRTIKQFSGLAHLASK